MLLKLIACKIITREASHLIARSDNTIDATFLRKGFHNEPDNLKRAIQDEIDRVESGQDIHTNDTGVSNEDFAAILIGYGLCSNGISGLHSSKYPLVIPKAHDCITFFLGSRHRYKHYFNAHSGTYWYSQSWTENTSLKNKDCLDNLRKQYEEKGYDEDAIDYLLECESSWIKNYNNAAFIRVPEVLPHSGDTACRDAVRNTAEQFGWNYEELEGDISLLRDFIDGNWREEDFVIIHPGEAVAPSFDENIIKTVPIGND